MIKDELCNDAELLSGLVLVYSAANKILQRLKDWIRYDVFPDTANQNCVHTIVNFQSELLPCSAPEFLSRLFVCILF